MIFDLENSSLTMSILSLRSATITNPRNLKCSTLTNEVLFNSRLATSIVQMQLLIVFYMKTVPMNDTVPQL